MLRQFMWRSLFNGQSISQATFSVHHFLIANDNINETHRSLNYWLLSEQLHDIELLLHISFQTKYSTVVSVLSVVLIVVSSLETTAIFFNKFIIKKKIIIIGESTERGMRLIAFWGILAPTSLLGEFSGILSLLLSQEFLLSVFQKKTPTSTKWLIVYFLLLHSYTSLLTPPMTKFGNKFILPCSQIIRCLPNQPKKEIDRHDDSFNFFTRLFVSTDSLRGSWTT